MGRIGDTWTYSYLYFSSPLVVMSTPCYSRFLRFFFFFSPSAPVELCVCLPDFFSISNVIRWSAKRCLEKGRTRHVLAVVPM